MSSIRDVHRPTVVNKPSELRGHLPSFQVCLCGLVMSHGVSSLINSFKLWDAINFHNPVVWHVLYLWQTGEGKCLYSTVNRLLSCGPVGKMFGQKIIIFDKSVIMLVLLSWFENKFISIDILGSFVDMS